MLKSAAYRIRMLANGVCALQMACPWATMEQIDECIDRNEPKVVVEVVHDFEDDEYEQMFNRLAGDAEVVTFEQLTAKAKMDLGMLKAADTGGTGCMTMPEFVTFMKS